jgi:hypothetical protein
MSFRRWTSVPGRLGGSCWLAALIGGLLAAPAPVLAQSGTPAPQAPASQIVLQPEPDRPWGQVRFGAFTLTPHIGISNVGVDMNVYNAANEPRPDFTATIAGGMDAQYRGTRFETQIQARARYVYYKTFPQERAMNPGVTVRAQYALTHRLRLFTDDQVEFLKDRPSVEIDARTRRMYSRVTVGAGLRLGERTDFVVVGESERTAYGADVSFLGVALRETLNSTRQRVTGTVSYKLSGYTTIRVIGGGERERFPYAGARNGESGFTRIGVQFNQRAMISGEVYAGYQLFKSETVAVQPDYGAITMDGFLTWRLQDVTHVSAGMQRRMSRSFRLDSPYYVDTTYQASIGRALTRVLDVGAGYQYWALGYQRFAGPGALPTDSLTASEDVARAVTLSAGISTRKRTRLAVYATNWGRRGAASALRDYDGWRFGLLLTAGALRIDNRGMFVNGPGL